MVADSTDPDRRRLMAATLLLSIMPKSSAYAAPTPDIASFPDIEGYAISDDLADMGRSLADPVLLLAALRAGRWVAKPETENGPYGTATIQHRARSHVGDDEPLRTAIDAMTLVATKAPPAYDSGTVAIPGKKRQDVTTFTVPEAAIMRVTAVVRSPTTRRPALRSVVVISNSPDVAKSSPLRTTHEVRVRPRDRLTLRLENLLPEPLTCRFFVTKRKR